MGVSVFEGAAARAAYEKGVREAVAGKVGADDVEKRAHELFPDAEGHDRLVVVKADGTVGTVAFHTAQGETK